jgi:DNA-binding NarL/FixJ family response regulator
MDANTAYITGILNSAFFRGDDGKMYLLENNEEAVPQLLDGYSWSQICAVKPEYSELRFTTMEELKTAIGIEAAKQEALEMALELMDTNFSETYRTGIAGLLAEALAEKQALTTFIENRLLASPLPQTFNPELALQALSPFAPATAKRFYGNLAEKAKLFGQFYTLLITSLDAENEDLQIINNTLTNNGCFAAFTNALYNRSAKKYDAACFMAISQLKELRFLSNDTSFAAIKEKLRINYSIELNDAESTLSDVYVSVSNVPEPSPALHLEETESQDNFILQDTGGNDTTHTPAQTKTIAIVDNHLIFRTALVRTIKNLGYTVLFEADNGLDFQRQLISIKTYTYPHIVLIDTQMPFMDGFAITLLWNHPGVKVLAMGYAEGNDNINEVFDNINRAFGHRAIGYISKDSNPNEFNTAINALINKDTESKPISSNPANIINKSTSR